MVGGTKVPFQVAPMQLETLDQQTGNNECGFYVMWAMLCYLGVKSEMADALVCIISISFISVNSTKQSTYFSNIFDFQNRFFEWQRKKFKHNRLLEMEVIALSSKLATFIVSECLEKETFSIAQSMKYKA